MQTPDALVNNAAPAKSLDSVKSQVLSFVQTEAGQLGALTDRAFKQGIVYAGEVEKAIRKRPMTAVAIAAGVGALTVSLLMRATRSSR